MSEQVKVGIEKIGIYIPKNYVDLSLLAKHRGVDPAKWTQGIGQDNMAVIDSHQDVISMGANACLKILDKEDKEKIDQIIFATESSLDFSKASSIYLHNLLEIQPFAKCFEIKQACYSATAAIQIGLDYVRLRPDRKILIVASDVSIYGLKSSGEVTQGAGAIAILVSSKPKVMEITGESVSYTNNCFDFWRPSYSDYPKVEGKYSTKVYVESFIRLFREYAKKFPGQVENLEAVLYHLPFSKMGKKALIELEDILRKSDNDLASKVLEKLEIWFKNYDKSVILGKEIGNIYTGSLYLGLMSLLFYGDLADGAKIGLFSYGSGYVAEFFTGVLSDNYKDFLYKEDIESLLARRNELTVEEYEKDYSNVRYTEDLGDMYNSYDEAEEGFYLEKVEEGKRYYSYKDR